MIDRACISAFAFVAVGACASPGMPPGGPVDNEAPQIVNIAPDSAKTGTTPRAVIFRFDEVVNERPSGAASLDALFLISPRDGVPRVDWNREEIAIRPRRGWRSNTAYTVTLLPGLSDLRGNTRNTGAVTVFSTGQTLPAGRITGTLFNWTDARVINRAGIVQAWPRGDTALVYITGVDSAGAYTLPNMPPGEYVVRGLGDDNANRGLDRREPWDTVSVTLRDSAQANLFAFIHDSLGTRLTSVVLKDSVTAELSFDNPLSLAEPLTAAQVRFVAPDSTEIPVQSLTPPPPDTTEIVRRLGRPVPPRMLTAKLARPVRISTAYRVRVTQARNLMGVARNSEALLNVPATLPAPARAQPTAPPPASPPPPPAPIRR